MSVSRFKESYNQQTRDLIEAHGTEKAMSAAVGGHFEAVGQLEYALLQQYGLERNHCVIDIGCGSGRLGVQLRNYLKGTYIGLDVVQELYKYAEMKCNRLDWKFYEAPGLSIPEADDCADFVCFFSVFTHLLILFADGLDE